MKKVLLVYPHNFLQGAMGTNMRVMQIAWLLKELGCQIDQFGYENFQEGSSFHDFNAQNTNGLINNLFVYNFEDDKVYNNTLLRKGHRLSQLLRGNYILSWVTPGVQNKFSQILENNKYDAILTFYTYLAPLFQNREVQAKKIYFMEDSVFIQQHSIASQRAKQYITPGKLLDSDLALMQVFDQVFCISKDEQLFYQRLLDKPVGFLPHIMPVKQPLRKDIKDKKWEVFFIGFSNLFNEEGLHWFMEEVYPRLDKHLNILLAGSAAQIVKEPYDNIAVTNFVEDLDATYADVKAVICPLFRGTGMKIKVVEAMAKGIPVVCTDRGVDGLPDKTLSGCLVTQDPEEFAEFLNHLANDEEFYRKTSQQVESYYNTVFDREYYKGVLAKTLDS